MSHLVYRGYLHKKTEIYGVVPILHLPTRFFFNVCTVVDIIQTTDIEWFNWHRKGKIVGGESTIKYVY